MSRGAADVPHDAQRRRPIGRVIISVSSMRKTDAAPAQHTAYGYTEDPIVLSWAIGLLISPLPKTWDGPFWAPLCP